MSRALLVRICLLTALGAGLAAAQTIPFNLLATEGANSANVPNDATITVSAEVGSQAQVDVRATYTGSSQATFASLPQLLGSTAFTVTLDGTLPIVLARSESITFHVKFAPTNSTAASAQVTLAFTEPGTGNTPTSNAIVLLFQGASPAFTLSYILQTDGNVVPILPGGTIPFNPTQLNTTAQASLNITDTGSGPGTITGIDLTAGGPIFKLQGKPLLPATLNAGQSLQLTVLYSPTAVQSDTGQVTITFQDGKTAIVNLTGSGATSSFTYNVLTGGTGKTVQPPGPIVLPPANVTSGTNVATSSVIVQVTNTGNANGTVNSISISGQGFQLANVPVNPPTLKPNDSFSFSIIFTPTQAGVQTGQLVIGSDVFTLTGTGLGPKLSFAYVSSAGTINVVPPDAVVFSPVTISGFQKVTFIITNSGTSTATISNIGTTTPFAVTGIAALPLTLAPGQSTQFAITFTPTTTGFANGTLQIDTTTVPLIGSGTEPPALPSYTLTGPSGNTPPLSQQGVGLTLASPYPLEIDGTLTLTTSGSLGTDPSVQFSTGGRTVGFVIPANGTSADFAGQGSPILLQTGTVAETVTLTPSFTTHDGVVVTPSPITTLQFTVAPAAPALLSVQSTDQTAASFTLLVIGFSTTRSLSSLNVTFNPATGFNLGTSTFSIDLTQVSTFWFQSATSQPFGGQFQISVPFVLSGTVPTGKTLLDTIASVSATVSNSVGTSNSLQTNVQ